MTDIYSQQLVRNQPAINSALPANKLLDNPGMANPKGQPPKKPYELRARDLFARKLEVARRDAGFESKAAGARALGMEAGTCERRERAEAEPNIYWLGRIAFVFKIRIEALIPSYTAPTYDSHAGQARGTGRGDARRPFRSSG